MNRKISSIAITAAIIVIAVSCNNRMTSGRTNTKNKDAQPTFVIDSLHVGDSVGVSGNFASAEIGSFSFGRNRQN